MPESSRPETYTSYREPSFSTVSAATEQATIGPSIVIKGEVRGTEALFIEGTIEGTIRFPDHRVTVGRASHVTADIHAHDVVVMGSVKGNIYASDLLDIRAESFIQGQMTSQRSRIDDGAVLKGSVEVHSAKFKAEDSETASRSAAAAVAVRRETPKAENPEPEVPATESSPKVEGASKAEVPTRAESTPARVEKATAAAANHSARRLPGSSTLLEIEK
jgi:cytoskeletal protein CcmA (bactofilin family)